MQQLKESLKSNTNFVTNDVYNTLEEPSYISKQDFIFNDLSAEISFLFPLDNNPYILVDLGDINQSEEFDDEELKDILINYSSDESLIDVLFDFLLVHGKINFNDFNIKLGNPDLNIVSECENEIYIELLKK